MDKRPFEIVGLDHVVLRSANPQALADFYSRLFGVPVERTVGDFLWQLRIGHSLLDIIAAPEVSGANMDHFCVRITPYNESDILDMLHKHGVSGEAAGNIYGSQGFGPSIYFVDPEGNKVELKADKT
ncbi:MAG: VOC family protein [bacterium]